MALRGALPTQGQWCVRSLEKVGPEPRPGTATLLGIRAVLIPPPWSMEGPGLGFGPPGWALGCPAVRLDKEASRAACSGITSTAAIATLPFKNHSPFPPLFVVLNCGSLISDTFRIKQTTLSSS